MHIREGERERRRAVSHSRLGGKTFSLHTAACRDLEARPVPRLREHRFLPSVLSLFRTELSGLPSYLTSSGISRSFHFAKDLHRSRFFFMFVIQRRHIVSLQTHSCLGMMCLQTLESVNTSIFFFHSHLCPVFPALISTSSIVKSNALRFGSHLSCFEGAILDPHMLMAK